MPVDVVSSGTLTVDQIVLTLSPVSTLRSRRDGLRRHLPVGWRKHGPVNSVRLRRARGARSTWSCAAIESGSRPWSLRAWPALDTDSGEQRVSVVRCVHLARRRFHRGVTGSVSAYVGQAQRILRHGSKCGAARPGECDRRHAETRRLLSRLRGRHGHPCVMNPFDTLARSARLAAGDSRRIDVAWSARARGARWCRRPSSLPTTRFPATTRRSSRSLRCRSSN